MLTAFLVLGVTAALPGTAGAVGPMIVQADDTAMEDDAEVPLFLALDPGAPISASSNPGGAAPSPDNSERGGPSLAGQEEETVQGPALKAAEPTELSIDIPPEQGELYRELRELRGIVDRLRSETDVRERLRATADEERDKDAEILEAAGREYSLRPPWTFGMDLNVQYSYNSYDVIRQLDLNEGSELEYWSDHTIHNSLSLESGVRENLSLGATIPFVYKYDKVDTAQSRDVANLGDISINLKYQPLKTAQGYPSPIFSFGVTLPSGKGTYDINPQTELATGSGLYSYSGGISLSMPFDPVSTFTSFNYTYRRKETEIDQRRAGGLLLKEVHPGNSISGNIGFGYSMSYRMSITLSLSYTYDYSYDYFWLPANAAELVKTSSGDSVSASLGLSTSWRVTPGRTIIISVGKGLTTANPGFSMSVRLPVSFDWR